jgi:hypothetical protein
MVHVRVQGKKKVEHIYKKIKQTVSYAAEVTAITEKGKLRKITGVKTKELMLRSMFLRPHRRRSPSRLALACLRPSMLLPLRSESKQVISVSKLKYVAAAAAGKYIIYIYLFFCKHKHV